jgi:hypothetical protein
MERNSMFSKRLRILLTVLAIAIIHLGWVQSVSAAC